MEERERERMEERERERDAERGREKKITGESWCCCFFFREREREIKKQRETQTTNSPIAKKTINTNDESANTRTKKKKGRELVETSHYTCFLLFSLSLQNQFLYKKRSKLSLSLSLSLSSHPAAYTHTLLSSLTLASFVPSPLHATPQTWSVCSLAVCKGPEAAPADLRSQSFTVESELAVAAKTPPGCGATAVTQLACPPRAATWEASRDVGYWGGGVGGGARGADSVESCGAAPHHPNMCSVCVCVCVCVCVGCAENWRTKRHARNRPFRRLHVARSLGFA